MQRHTAALVFAALNTLGLVPACDDAATVDAADASDDLAPGVPTYYRDVAPLLARHCTGCHSPGQAGPFRLDNPDDARHHAELSLGAMQAGLMPPWMPDRACRTFDHERGMAPAEIAAFAAWVAADRPLGDPADLPLLPTPPVWNPTLVLPISQGHLPSGEVADDYRCFVLDTAATFSSDTYLTASQVAPGSSQVHHVLVYALPPESAEAIAAADAASPGPGYTCFGGPLPNSAGSEDTTAFFAGGEVPDLTLPTQIGSWVPGAQPRRYPAGTAIRIRAGSTLIAQVHYNLSEGAPIPDSSRIELELTETTPTYLVDVRPLAVRDLTIPAGEGAAVNVGWFPYYAASPRTLISLAGHMHLLGTRLHAEVVRKLAPEAPECALSIPRWDFHWQQSYWLRPDDYLTLEDGDGVRVTCEYDNRAANQPVVNGVRRPPVDVGWGEGTGDEMCILYYSALTAFAPVAAAAQTHCAPAADCLASCGETPSLDCVLGCERASANCQLCALRAGLRCSEFACIGALRSAGECISRCLGANVMLGGNTGRCMSAECGEPYAALLACMDPGLTEAACGAELEACGVTFPEDSP